MRMSSRAQREDMSMSLEEFIAKSERLAPDYWIRVLSEPETAQALGLSQRTFDRLKAVGDVPAKTRLSEGRVGYRVCDIAAWLDARRAGAAS
jgi:predicted DNA-binding transcriptional regulator AlpA